MSTTASEKALSSIANIVLGLVEVDELESINARELEARVKALEDRLPKPASPTHDGRVVVDAKQVERWERIERAARTIISTIDESRTTASADSYAVIISGQFDRLVLGGLRKDLQS